MILCDSNILIEFYNNNQDVIQNLRGIGQENLAISAVTQAELYYGALNKRELQKIKKHLALLHCYPPCLLQLPPHRLHRRPPPRRLMPAGQTLHEFKVGWTWIRKSEND